MEMIVFMGAVMLPDIWCEYDEAIIDDAFRVMPNIIMMMVNVEYDE